jgi:hypothetical protein
MSYCVIVLSRPTIELPWCHDCTIVLTPSYSHAQTSYCSSDTIFCRSYTNVLSFWHHRTLRPNIVLSFWHRRIVVLTPSYCRFDTIVLSFWHHRTVIMTPSNCLSSQSILSSTIIFFYGRPLLNFFQYDSTVLYHRTVVLSPSYCWTVTIVLLNCHHRTVELSPSHYHDSRFTF